MSLPGPGRLPYEIQSSDSNQSAAHYQAIGDYLIEIHTEPNRSNLRHIGSERKNKAALRKERDQRYRDRHQDRINQRRRENRHKRQSLLQSPSISNVDIIPPVKEDDPLSKQAKKEILKKERDRKYREQHRKEINQRQKERRQCRQNMQHIASSSDMHSSDDTQQYIEDMIDEHPCINYSNLNIASASALAQDLSCHELQNMQYSKERQNIIFIDTERHDTDYIWDRDNLIQPKVEIFEEITNEQDDNKEFIVPIIKEELPEPCLHLERTLEEGIKLVPIKSEFTLSKEINKIESHTSIHRDVSIEHIEVKVEPNTVEYDVDDSDAHAELPYTCLSLEESSSEGVKLLPIKTEVALNKEINKIRNEQGKFENGKMGIDKNVSTEHIDIKLESSAGNEPDDNTSLDASLDKSEVLSVTSTKKLHSCNVCGKVYKRKNAFLTHKRSHTGQTTILEKEEQNTIVNWIHHMTKLGFTVTKDQVIYSVGNLGKNLYRLSVFQDGEPGRQWYEEFLKRNPNTCSRIKRGTSPPHVGEKEKRHWFSTIYKYLEENNFLEILHDPSRIYHCDEAIFILSHRGQADIVRNDQKFGYCNDESNKMTLCLGASADGNLMPTLAFLPHNETPTNVIQSYPKTWVKGRSDSGWIKCQTFHDYIGTTFNSFLITKEIKRPVLLFLDSKVSHLSLQMTTFCGENGIIAWPLLPHSSYTPQPINLAVFETLQKSWKRNVYYWGMANNKRKMKEEDFSQILEDCIQSTLRPDILQIGFQCSGLYPFDENLLNLNDRELNKSSGSGSTHVDAKSEITPICPSTSAQFIPEFEKRLGAEKLKIFKDCKGVWQGNVADENLYYFWKNLAI